jgi:hypothetical protein
VGRRHRHISRRRHNNSKHPSLGLSVGGEIQMAFRRALLLVFGFSFLFGAIPSRAQLGNSGSIEGVVKDASGGVIAGAKVEVSNPVSGFHP